MGLIFYLHLEERKDMTCLFLTKHDFFYHCSLRGAFCFQLQNTLIRGGYSLVYEGQI